MELESSETGEEPHLCCLSDMTLIYVVQPEWIGVCQRFHFTLGSDVDEEDLKIIGRNPLSFEGIEGKL